MTITTPDELAATTDNTIQQRRILRSPEGKKMITLLAAMITALDGSAESSMIYQPLSYMVGSVISKPDFLKHLIPASLALTNFIAEFSSSNKTIRNTIISFITAARERNFDKKSSAAFAAGILATMPEAFFTATAFGELSDTLSDDHDNISNVIRLSRYPVLAGLCLAHAIVYSTPIKELISQTPQETINQIHSSLSAKPLINSVIAMSFLAPVCFRIYKFSTTERDEAEDFFGSESLMPLISTSFSLIGFIPLNLVAASKAAHKLFQRQPDAHAELPEDLETQTNNEHSHNHGHHHGHHGAHGGGYFHNALFGIGAMVSTIPVMGRDFKQDGLTAWTAIQAILLTIAAFIVFKYIHNHGHESEHMAELETNPQPSNTPRPRSELDERAVRSQVANRAQSTL